MAALLAPLLLAIGAPQAAAADPRPNLLFLVVESTDGRTWSPGYQNGVLALPAIRELQSHGFEFQRHYANAPVCCPSRATFWSGRHASNLAHRHGDVLVGGAWNNYEGLPAGYPDRIDQVLERAGYNVQVAGKRDWDTAGHGESSEHTDLALWSMYIRFPYNISNGGWGYETTGGGCDSEGTVGSGGSNGSTGSQHSGDWATGKTARKWLHGAAASMSGAPFFLYQGMDIVHPPYRTSKFWLDTIDETKVEVPAWAPLPRTVASLCALRFMEVAPIFQYGLLLLDTIHSILGKVYTHISRPQNGPGTK